jgi:hypothetical protein
VVGAENSGVIAPGCLTYTPGATFPYPIHRSPSVEVGSAKSELFSRGKVYSLVACRWRLRFARLESSYGTIGPCLLVILLLGVYIRVTCKP